MPRAAVSSRRIPTSSLQLESINTGLAASKVNLEEQRTVKRAKEEAAEAEYKRLGERQRAYFKAVKTFQEECDRNEALTAAMAEAGLAE